MAGRHGQAVSDGESLEPLVDLDPGGQLGGGQQVEDPVVERDPPGVDQQADGGGSEGLAQRVDELVALRGVWRPPAARDDVAVSRDQEAVRVVAVGLEGVDEGKEPAGVDVLGRG